MSNEFTNTLTRIVAGGSSAAMIDKLNLPLSEIEADLNLLATRISSITSKSAIIRQYAPLHTSVNVGDLVYFDTDNSYYAKAYASLLAEPGANGASIEAPQSHVEGLVIEKSADSAGTSSVFGTLLIGGYWEGLASIIESTTGTVNPLPGSYYLAGPETAAGKAVQIQPGEPFQYVRQPVFMYHGLTGETNSQRAMITMSMFYLAHDNHFHGSALLNNSNWTTATTIPASLTGTWKWYNRAADHNLDNAGDFSAATTVLFEDGLLQSTSTFFIDTTGTLWRNFNSPYETPGTIVLFNHYPFAYGASVVRNVQSNDTASLRVVNENGVVTLYPNSFTESSTEPAASAISQITGSTITRTPIVSQVTPGSGVTVTPHPTIPGGVVVSLEQNVDTHIDATTVNYNGSNMASDGIFIYTVFPAGRICSVAAAAHLSFGKYTGVSTIKASIYEIGTGALSVDLYWVPDSATVLPDTAKATNQPFTAVTSGQTVTDTSIVAQVSEGFSLDTSESGTAIAVIKQTSSSSSSDIRLWRLGFMVSLPTDTEEEQG